MQLVNSSPVPAHATVAEVPGISHRVGVLTAKATFRFDHGVCELDTQHPLALFRDDQPTDLGELPRDLSPRRDHVFEVMLLGRAHAPEGTSTTELEVGLSIGTRRTGMLVFGDRRWGPDARPTAPEPFTSMPLTWERAFGGRAEVEVDDGAVVELSDPLNPRGRGFDAHGQARAYGEALRAPAGFPRCDYDRLLPNLEHPVHRITSPAETPKPICWAPVPAGSGFHLLRAIERQQRDETAEPGTALCEVFQRAHPDWILDAPASGTVTLEGLTPRGALSFALPSLRVIADFIVGTRRGSRELAPTMLILLPEERRLSLTYRTTFAVDYEPDLERCFRIRLEEGG